MSSQKTSKAITKDTGETTAPGWESVSSTESARIKALSARTRSNVTLTGSFDETGEASATLSKRTSRRGVGNRMPGQLVLKECNGYWRERIVIITDPGQDLDDEMTFILLRCLQELGLVEVQCVVANLHPSFKRALLCRGALDMLGMHDVPVGYGSDGGDTTGVHKDDFRETAPYMPSENSQQAFALPAGRTLLYRIFNEAQPKSLSLCLISSLKDAAGFLRDNEELFVLKVKDVTIMGGVKFPTVQGQAMEPDTAHNNEFDRPGAEFFYRRVQELGIQLIIVSRNVVYACPVPREVYDELAQSGSPIGWRLRNAQRSSIEGLWRRAASSDPETRMGLPARCDAKWFKKTFCGSNPDVDDRGQDDPIWDLVKSFNMYDSMALIAAISLMRDHLFAPFYHEYSGVRHMIIGASNEDIGTTPEQAEDCVTFLNHAYKVGISLDHHQKTQIIISTIIQPNIADTYMGLALLRTLIETDTMDCLGIVISSEERYIAYEELEVQAATIREALASLGLQAVKVCTQHTSIRENRLEQLYESAPPTGVRLLISHALTDAASFAMMAPNLFRDKTLSVVLMGGVVQPETAGEMLQPDLKAARIASDPESATFFIRRCQELGVPLTVLFRNFSSMCRLPRAAFDAMSTHGGRIGKRGADEIQRDVEWVYAQVMMPSGDENRQLPPKCDEAWFEENFCNKKSSGMLWERISAWKLYTPLMILATVPKINNRFFETTDWQVRGITHNLVGFNKNSRGITQENLQNLKLFMFQLIFKGILLNSNEYAIPKLVDVPGFGSFDPSDSIPDWISVTRDLQMVMQECVDNTFLQCFFEELKYMPTA